MTTKAAEPGLVYRDDKHTYHYNGKRVPGVTTVISGGVPKPFLVPWAAKVAAEKAGELRRSRLSDKDFVREAKNAPNDKRDSAGVRGSAIHDLAEKLVHGEQVEVPALLFPYVEGYARFIDRFHVQPLVTEKSVYLDEFGVAGRFDFVGTIPALSDGIVLGDWKTSNGIYPETKLQTAAYASASFWVQPDAPDVEIPLPEIQATFVTHITAEGTFLHPLAKTPEEIREHLGFFRAAHSIYRFGLAAHRVAGPMPEPSIEF